MPKNNVNKKILGFLQTGYPGCMSESWQGSLPSLWILIAGKGPYNDCFLWESRCIQLLRLMTVTWYKERRSSKILIFMFAFSPQALKPSQWEKRDRSLQSQQESVSRKRFSKIFHVFSSVSTQPVNGRNYQPNWTQKLLPELEQ